MIRSVAYPLFIASAVTAAPAFAEWGAVAVNKNTGHFGWSWGTRDRGKARTFALGFCREFSKGVEGCEVRLQTRKCYGVAYSGRNVFVSEAGSSDRAGRQSLTECKTKYGSACTLHGAHCANE